jgi:phosphoenolpyruvate synthase/pyruvate phosphate dikinase
VTVAVDEGAFREAAKTAAVWHLPVVCVCENDHYARRRASGTRGVSAMTRSTSDSQRTKWVYDFAEGNRNLKDLLGGKGANLAEMTNLGLPVPPGFTITTDACRAYLTTGDIPAGLDQEIDEHLATLEVARGRRLGDPDDPLLVSVRSGAKFSMPGMMDTVLNIGLNDVSVHGLARQTGDARFAWDSYRRLIQMFGKTVLHVDGERFEAALEEAKASKGTTSDLDLGPSERRSWWRASRPSSSSTPAPPFRRTFAPN